MCLTLWFHLLCGYSVQAASFEDAWNVGLIRLLGFYKSKHEANTNLDPDAYMLHLQLYNNDSEGGNNQRLLKSFEVVGKNILIQVESYGESHCRKRTEEPGVILSSGPDYIKIMEPIEFGVYSVYINGKKLGKFNAKKQDTSQAIEFKKNKDYFNSILSSTENQISQILGDLEGYQSGSKRAGEVYVEIKDGKISYSFEAENKPGRIKRELSLDRWAYFNHICSDEQQGHQDPFWLASYSLKSKASQRSKLTFQVLDPNRKSPHYEIGLVMVHLRMKKTEEHPSAIDQILFLKTPEKPSN